MTTPPWKGRGSSLDLPGRFESSRVDREAEDDAGWEVDAPARPQTRVESETARSVITRNQSPDVPFAQSLNPYRGCEHGCSYCFARPSHAYLNLSPGINFETRLFAKHNADTVLLRELGRPGYRCEPITLGSNTDPYQPIEREHALTRRLLAVFLRTRHPLGLITKNALVERDIDLLAELAAFNLVHVTMSVTTLDNRLSARLEPRATAPARRIEAIRHLRAAGIPVGVLVAPVIPALTDQFMEGILAAVAEAGAQTAGYVLLRLPHEVAPIFRDWLQQHVPDRAAHVMSLVQQMRGGRDYDARFGQRMRGEGVFARLLQQRFEQARRRLGLGERLPPLDCSQFRPPLAEGPQGDLFG